MEDEKPKNSFIKSTLKKPWSILQKTNLTFWIFTGMIVGIIIGVANPSAGQAIAPLGKAFIRMIQTIETPLIFSTLVVGIAGHGDDLKRIGRLAIKSIVYYELVTTLALIIGLCMVNAIKPGVGVNLKGLSNSTALQLSGNSSGISWDSELFLIIPTSFFDAAAKNTVLSVVFCAILFAVAIIKADHESKRIMLDFNQSLSNIMFKVVALVMNYAPIGIGAALAATIGANGISVLANLGKLIATLYASLVIFALVVFLPIALMVRVPLKEFVFHALRPWLVAFSTASSESALPIAMENMQAFGVPKKIVSFVIPCGYSFNLDGTTLYLSLASIFCAQAGGLDLPISTQLSIMATLILSSKGVAAIPRASLIVLAAVVTQYDLPPEAVTLIIGVDAIMDMARTSINVVGNMLSSVVMAKWEGEFRSEEWEMEQRALKDALVVEDELAIAEGAISQEVRNRGDKTSPVVTIE